jgi:group II intron reverse transcriptase/maturase
MASVGTPKKRKVCEMQKTETILGVLRERGLKKLPVERLYRQMFNPDLYLQAYARISRNDGALTPGTTDETADGMNLAKIDQIIDNLRHETYRWSPVRRKYIAKKNSSKLRPLGIPTWSDKLVQEVMRMLLEAYYEPQFSPYSHGFRPGRGCHTALQEIKRTWLGTVWFIEGDIRGCFDNIDHDLLLSMTRKDIHDGRFLRLLQELLRAGYMENWKYGRTLSGTPQGGIISPLLSNIFLNKLDQFVEQQLLPQYNRGTKRAKNHAYDRLTSQINKARKCGDHSEANHLRKQRRLLPSRDTHDPAYRRLRYCRYADDFLLGFIGTRTEAEEIKVALKEFLGSEMKLEMSDEKTLITHAKTEKAHFLGYELSIMHSDTRLTGEINGRYANGKVRLGIPEAVIQNKVKQYLVNGKPIHYAAKLHDSAFSIVANYQSIYRGLVNYYILAHNLQKMTRLKWVMDLSLTATLANKFRTSRTKIYQRYRAEVKVGNRQYKALQITLERSGKSPLVATWGGIPLIRTDTVQFLDDTPAQVWNRVESEVLERLLADTCEVCGKHTRCDVHHVRRMSDLKVRQGREIPKWKELMISRRRKKLVVCKDCHHQIHQEQPYQRHKRT